MLEEEKKEQKNMVIAMALVIVVLMVFNRFTRNSVPTEGKSVPVEVTETAVVTPDETKPVIEEKANSDESLLGMKNVAINNESVVGNMGIFQDRADQIKIAALNLKKYKETTAPDSPIVSLLNNAYGITVDWNGLGPLTTGLADVTELTPEHPVTLNLENDKVLLNRVISIDQDYMITIKDKVINKANTPLTATLNAKIIRQADTVSEARSTVHEGFLGLFDNNEKEKRYSEIKEDKPFQITNLGGWIGQTDKYWQTIIIPEQTIPSEMVFQKTEKDYISSCQTKREIGANGTITNTTKLFAGAKELKIINGYTDQGIPRFDLSIDFGWYYFLTKPFLYFLGWLYALIGNMGISILVFATLIRIALLPIATKSYESMAKMKKIQPKLQAIQERFKDNRQQLQIETMNLYKRDKVNPASGCLPMFIQIPVFFALYKVLSVSILMRQAPFFGWITDLSQPDPASVFTLFGLVPWPIPSFLNIGVWPVLMGMTMVIQQRLSPQTATNEDQKIIMNLMPIMFTFMMGNFASGLVIYWTWSNILSIAQQRYIMKKVGI